MVPVAAEILFHIGEFPVTNSIVNGWIAVFGFAALAYAIGRRKLVDRPKGLQNAAEAAVEFMLGFMDQVTRDRERSKRFLPIVGSIFLFIMASNWMGLVPGVGTIGIWLEEHGETELVPIFRAATSDLNLTIAMGVSAVLISHVAGVLAIGFFRHWGKFVQLHVLWDAVIAFRTKRVMDAAIGLFVAAIEFMVGIIELVSEAAKMVSLSLRLFGNIFAGEVLLHVLSSLVAYAVPLPFLFMELIVGVVQALVFSMLTLVYLTMATEPPHGSEERHADEGHAQGRPAHA